MENEQEKPALKGNPEHLTQVKNWINNQLSLGSAPRFLDVFEYAKRNNMLVPTATLRQLVRQHPSYMFNSHQQREPLRSRKQMMILGNSLGMLHCDIGYFPVVREYTTPPKYQHGFLIAKDVLSRYTYVELLNGRKTAENLVKVLQRLIENHKKNRTGYSIKCISFDKEPGIDSHLVKKFLKDQKIKLVLFKNSASKAKMAEGGIRLIKTAVARVLKTNSNLRWWKELPRIVNSMNHQEIVIEGKKIGYRPVDVTARNLLDFIQRLYKKAPPNYFAQFRVRDRYVKFAFKVGDIVRAKLIVTSSQVIGIKRSQVNLGFQTFRVIDQVPFTTKDSSVRPGYRCQNTFTGDIESFAEEDLALSRIDYDDDIIEE